MRLGTRWLYIVVNCLLDAFVMNQGWLPTVEVLGACFVVQVVPICLSRPNHLVARGGKARHYYVQGGMPKGLQVPECASSPRNPDAEVIRKTNHEHHNDTHPR